MAEEKEKIDFNANDDLKNRLAFNRVILKRRSKPNRLTIEKFEEEEKRASDIVRDWY